MDRTVSRRSEPSSRTALMGEQPNPWDVLPPQDAMSRHRICVNKIIVFESKILSCFDEIFELRYPITLWLKSPFIRIKDQTISSTYSN